MARSVPALASDLSRLARDLGGVRQALVVTVPELKVLAAQGPESEPEAPCTVLVRRCHEKGATVTVPDTALDQQLQRGRELPFRSAVCVLLPGEKRVLYLDSLEKGRFTEAVVDKIAARVQSWNEQPAAVPSQPPKAQGRPDRRLSAVLAGLAVLWLGLGYATTPGDRPSPTPTSPRAAPSARSAAESLVALMRLKQVNSVYPLLSGAAQRGLSAEPFEQALSTWLQDPKNRWDLQYRRVGDEKDGLVQVEGPRDSPTWKWTFVREGPDWKLDRAEAGPIRIELNSRAESGSSE